MKVLPLGSVVTLKNAKTPAKFMIVVRNGLLSMDGVMGYMDYVACLYPVGFQDKTHYFNQEDISEVLFVGYVDDFERKYQADYEARMKKIQSKYPKLKVNHKVE
ncbi:DUF4176 domain-containing protein [Pasteurella sp. PK-2025]|uniref:DUF4176 domain-containing protein n=1 Tax=unclassified Pasteurella TaxID=2621516 RepID=UPI003C767FBE